MKKTWKYAMAAFALVAFTACGSDENTTTESDSMETEETNMDMNTDMGGELEEDSTIIVEDTTVNDGVADEIQEEQPPVQ